MSDRFSFCIANTWQQHLSNLVRQNWLTSLGWHVHKYTATCMALRVLTCGTCNPLRSDIFSTSGMCCLVFQTLLAVLNCTDGHIKGMPSHRPLYRTYYLSPQYTSIRYKLLQYPEDGGNKFLRSVWTFNNCTVRKPKRRPSFEHGYVFSVVHLRAFVYYTNLLIHQLLHN
jgi:hypothetical protein